MIFSIISQQYQRQNLFADLDFIQNRNNKFLSSIMLLLLSYCSVFKVQIWQILLHCGGSRHWSFLCQLSCSQESWWAWEDSNLRPHAYQACALTTWATSPCQFLATVVVPSSSDALWWRWGGSNSWPPACKAGALPAELHPRMNRASE